MSHVDDHGKARMVDVGGKMETKREAEAVAVVKLGDEAFRLLRENQLSKGDALTVAEIAGIMGAKKTSELIPLCHQVPLSSVKLWTVLQPASSSVQIHSVACSVGQTGVEMEALTAVSIAALTLYDMCKSVTKGIVISEIKLLRKSGGKSGEWKM